MFDINNYPTVLQHLRDISIIFKKYTGEYQIHCPSCDDATRGPNARTHGHCYISIYSPVYYCWRCNDSGTLVKLLVNTDFTDVATLKAIGRYLKHSYVKDYQFNKRQNDKSIYQIVSEQTIKFKINFPQYYDKFCEYIYARLGDINYSKFLIYPGFSKQTLKDGKTIDHFSCFFMNYDGINVTERIIESKGKFRYTSSKDLYYFQSMNFNNIRHIILTEGVFDAASLYAYNSNFPPKESIFIGMSGKRYITALERLIISHLLTGKFKIHLVFDDDVLNWKTYIHKCNIIKRTLNEYISVEGWMSEITKDTGDYPLIKKL